MLCLYGGKQDGASRNGPGSMNPGVTAEPVRARAQRASAPAGAAFTIEAEDGVLAGVRVRPAGEEHLPFLCHVYASARVDEMATTGWSEAEKNAFIEQQFAFQHRYYREHHPDAQFLLISRQAQAIGRLYWRSQGDQAALMDISLLPEHRGAGIGSAILGLLMTQADAAGQVTTLYVEHYNPAFRLYRRFGFEVVADSGVYLKMCRAPLGNS